MKISQIRYCVALSLLTIASLSHSSDEILVSFSNGEKITKEDLNTYVGRRVDLKAMSKSTGGIESILKEMAIIRAWVLEGERIKEPRKTDMTRRFDEVYALSISRKLTPQCIKLEGKQEIERYFNDNRNIFEVPASVRLARIMLPIDHIVEGLKTDVWLHNQAELMSKSVIEFDDIAANAAKFYQDEVQGDLGWVVPGTELPILRAIGAAKKGDLIGPYTDNGYGYLFLIMDKRPPLMPKFEDIKHQVPTRAYQYCVSSNKAASEERILKLYEVNFNYEQIRMISKNGEAGKM